MSSRNRTRGSGADGVPKSKSSDKAALKATHSGGKGERKSTRSGETGERESGGNVASIPRPEPESPIDSTNKAKAKAKSLPGGGSVKRKASGKIESVSKKSKKSGPEQEADDDGDDFTVRKDIISVMAPLLDEISKVLLLFGPHSATAWYKALTKRRTKLEEACKTVSSRQELMKHNSLEASFSPGSMPGIGTASKNLVTSFQALEKHRLACISQSKSYPPSLYCQTWQQVQDDPNLAIHAGRGKAPIFFPLPLPLIHPAFRLFVFWMKYPPNLDFKTEPSASLNSVAKCVDTLLLSMPAIYWTHDQRLQAFKKALVIAFPENEIFEWYTNCTTSLASSNPTGARERVDLVYRNRDTHVASVFVEVKLEPGKGGDPFWQNGRIYQLYVERNPKARENGAPVFFIQLSGIHMDIGGAFCDPQGGPPVILPMGGSKVLQFDYLGWHRREAIHALWALRESIQLLNVPDEVVGDNLLTPQFIPKGLKITKTLDLGVVYQVEVVDRDCLPNFLANIGSNSLLIKIIYTGFHRQHYGSIVHRFLAEKDMAPTLYGATSPVPQEFKEGPGLETYIFMEYLPPPSDGEAGWITLHDLGVEHRSFAQKNKDKIVAAVKDIVEVLRGKEFVHGDLRTNNLMIYIVVRRKTCQLQLKDDGNPRIKVIDFDWSGRRNEVCYPTLRNSAVKWPGQDGMYISADHDSDMVKSWAAEWPLMGIERTTPFLQIDRADPDF